jgi:Flp pilus assembly protein TadD
VPLRNYVRLAGHPARLFNAGLTAARAGDLTTARDLFAAVVHWCPLDWEARSALALASYQLGDLGQARLHWRKVLDRQPQDPIATAGLANLNSSADQAANDTRRA